MGRLQGRGGCGNQYGGRYRVLSQTDQCCSLVVITCLFTVGMYRID